MLTDYDVAKARIDEIAEDERRTLKEAGKVGTLPRLQSFETVFGKTIQNAKSDPRITPEDLKKLVAYADEQYKKVSREFGFSDQIDVDAASLRGHVVHDLLLMKSGKIVRHEIFADEKTALAIANEWLRGEGVQKTIQEIRKWEQAEDWLDGSKHPLDGTPYYGTGVMTCTIH